MAQKGRPLKIILRGFERSFGSFKNVTWPPTADSSVSIGRAILYMENPLVERTEWESPLCRSCHLDIFSHGIIYHTGHVSKYGKLIGMPQTRAHIPVIIKASGGRTQSISMTSLISRVAQRVTWFLHDSRYGITCHCCSLTDTNIISKSGLRILDL